MKAWFLCLGKIEIYPKKGKNRRKNQKNILKGKVRILMEKRDLA
jgi:hypothetical protein